MRNMSTARMMSADNNVAEGNVIKSNRNDGYDTSIIPLALVNSAEMFQYILVVMLRNLFRLYVP